MKFNEWLLQREANIEDFRTPPEEIQRRQDRFRNYVRRSDLDKELSKDLQDRRAKMKRFRKAEKKDKETPRALPWGLLEF